MSYSSISHILKDKIFVIVCISTLLVCAPSILFATAGKSIEIIPPENNPYGLPYEQHGENLWTWLVPLAKSTSPWDDQTGENCTNGQTGSNSSIFYLSSNGGGKSERTCKVPAGKGLFIPVSPMEVSDKEAP